MVYDCIIIGAGVSGSAAARELSKYDMNVCVLEKDEDVCSGTSKASYMRALMLLRVPSWQSSM